MGEISPRTIPLLLLMWLLSVRFLSLLVQQLGIAWWMTDWTVPKLRRCNAAWENGASVFLGGDQPLMGRFLGVAVCSAVHLLRPWLTILQIWYAELQRATSRHFIQQEQYAECMEQYIMLSTMNNHAQGISNWALKINGHFWPSFCASAPCLQNGKCTNFQGE